MNEPAAPASEEVLNPFMMGDTDSSTFAGDNPFATSNPFSDFGDTYEPPAGDTVPIDIFGGQNTTGLGAKGFEDTSMDIFGSQPVDTEKLMKPTELELISTIVDCPSPVQVDNNELEPPARPLPPETQNLILSVTGQMEFTSTHLLDRIPPTRTPSPVSARDIHSPSLTPEPGELLEEAVPLENIEVNKMKPARPPPARPPRPAPPSVPPPRPLAPPQVQQPKQQPTPETTQMEPSDDINLFDAPVPVTTKPTKEDILSLYSAPKKEEKQIDFLSDDIPEVISSDKSPEILPQMSNVITSTTSSQPVETTPSIFQDSGNDTIGEQNNMSLFTNVMDDTSVPMDCSEPMEITPIQSHNSPFTEHADEEFQDINETEKNPFESNEVSDISSFGNIASDIFPSKPDENVPNLFFSMPDDNTTDIFSTNPEGNAVDIFSSKAEDNTTDVFASKPEDTYMTSSKTDIFSGGQNESFLDDTTTKTMEETQFNAFGETIEKNEGQSRNAFDTDITFVEEKSVAAPTSDLGWDNSEMIQDTIKPSEDAFDAFSAKFDSTVSNHMNTDAWGDDGSSDVAPGGFEAEAFDPFLTMEAPPPPPAATPRLEHQGSRDSTDDTFSVFIRPKDDTGAQESAVPVLAPPPRPQALPDSPRYNPFDKSEAEPQPRIEPQFEEPHHGSGSGGETPPTPLFDEDMSMPLEDFPRTQYNGPGWEMHLRQPNKKKITGQRFWKKMFVRLVYQGDTPAVQLLNSATDKEPLQELPLQACYSVSDVGAQQFDQFGKIFTVKLQYVFYKERPGVRPGQVTKAERITSKLSQFAAYAMQGDYQGVKEFGSDLRKLGLPVEHAPQVSQLFKLGSLCYEDVKQFSCCVEEALFRISAHRDRALTYKMEEVQLTAVDELYVEQDAEGSVLKQIARVRLFFLGFLSGMPDVEVGLNDLRRQGREVVGRHDIIPVATEEWIRVENAEFHACVQPDEFASSQILKFKPPDACYIELMRFRVRPPKNRELPLQLKAAWCVAGNKVELRADVLVPGFASRKLGQVPCEDVAIRFPIPECWIYLFRVEKHFRYGSVKSAHRRTGKIKGIERFLGAVDTLQESLIEVTSGQAKYEHQHRAIVWRMPRLPKEGQGAYTTHNLVCRMALTSYDQVPGELARHAFVEFTMPATQVSHTTVRSVSLQQHDGDPPEKYVRYLARHEYTVGIERTTGQSAPAYALAAATPAPVAPTPAAPPERVPSSDSDSD
ncbi:unnamed protein product, partial [Iphiclides podalirius]